MVLLNLAFTLKVISGVIKSTLPYLSVDELASEVNSNRQRHSESEECNPRTEIELVKNSIHPVAYIEGNLN